MLVESSAIVSSAVVDAHFPSRGGPCFLLFVVGRLTQKCSVCGHPKSAHANSGKEFNSAAGDAKGQALAALDSTRSTLRSTSDRLQVAKYERTHVTAGEGSWWNGVEYAKVENVFTSGKKGDGTLKVTDEGLSWSAGLSKKKIPFEEIVQLGAEETSSQRGKQRSAFGFGPIGVAFVAATAISNHNARKVDTVSTLQVLTRDNEITTFSTKESFEPLASFFVAYRNSPLAAQEVADEQTEAAPTGGPQLGVADEIKKLMELRDLGAISEEEFQSQKAKLL